MNIQKGHTFSPFPFLALILSFLLGFFLVQLLFFLQWGLFWVLLLLPPCIGALCLLQERSSNQNLSWSTRLTAWLAWSGFWLACLLWLKLHPELSQTTTSGCWASECDPGTPPMPPTTEIMPFGEVVFVYAFPYAFGFLSMEGAMRLARRVFWWRKR